MKIAVVAPWVPAIKGNSLAASFARSLSRNAHDVDFIVHTLKEDLEKDLIAILGDRVNLITLHRSTDEKINSLRYLKLQYFSKIDGELTEFILNRGDYDLLVLISNEGRGIARRIKENNKTGDLKTAIIVQELIDYSFDMNKEGIPAYIRKIFLFLKPIFRYIERRRLKGFELVYSNSKWTSGNLLNLYGVKSRMTLALYDDENFKIDDSFVKEKRIAVPTASLDGHGIELLLRLQLDGIPLVAFGPKNVEGLNNVGFLRTEEMRRLISESKATLFYFDYEALGLIPFESLSLGTPVITLPKQGPYEELKDNEYVHFFNDYDSLLRTCRNLLIEDQEEKYRLECSRSVELFHSDMVAGRFLEDVDRYMGGGVHS